MKVKEQEEDDLLTVLDRQACPRLPLEVFESLTTHDVNSSVTKCEDDSPPSIVKISKSYISNPAIPTIPPSKVEGKSSNKKKAVEDSKPNIRASSIPRPRAVLSSPDNDGMIGRKNKIKPERLAALKDHNMCTDRHTRCKVVHRQNTFETSITTKRELKEASDGKTDLKERRAAAIADPRQRAHLRKGNSESV